MYEVVFQPTSTNAQKEKCLVHMDGVLATVSLQGSISACGVGVKLQAEIKGNETEGSERAPEENNVCSFYPTISNRSLCSKDNTHSHTAKVPLNLWLLWI